MICCIRDCSYFLTIGTKKEKSFRWSKGLFGKLFLSANCLPNSIYKMWIPFPRKLLGPFSFVIAISRSFHFYEGVIIHTYSPYSYLISRNSSRWLQMFGFFLWISTTHFFSSLYDLIKILFLLGYSWSNPTGPFGFYL